MPMLQGVRKESMRIGYLSIDAAGRSAVERFVRSDPYHLNGVWERLDIHGYSKKRGTPIVSKRSA